MFSHRPSIKENHQLYAGQCSIPENILPPRDTQPPCKMVRSSIQSYPSVTAFSGHNPLGSALVNQSWSPPDTRLVSEAFSSLSSPTTANEGHAGRVALAYSAYNPTQASTHRDSQLIFNPFGTQWPSSPDQHLPLPPVDRETNTVRYQPPDQSRTPALGSYVVHPPQYPGLPNNRILTKSLIPPDLPLHQSFTPTPSHDVLHSPSTEFPKADTRSDLSSSCAPHGDSPCSCHCRRAARTIECDGLWVDEEELLKSLMEFNGKLHIHPCRWGEDQSPCHLWIRGDKSSVNAHIQKWHGREPRGDKDEVDCRWSGCGKTMRKDSIGRHIVRIHLGEMWECRGCGKRTTRNDTYKQHLMKSKSEACRIAGALTSYSTDMREIDARVALDGRRWPPYASALLS